MTTAITFSRQNDADSSAQKIFTLEVVLVSESKGLYFLLRDRRALVEKEMKTTSVSRLKCYWFEWIVDFKVKDHKLILEFAPPPRGGRDNNKVLYSEAQSRGPAP